MREAERARSGRKPRKRPAPAHAAASPGQRWATRLTVLGSLAAATIAVPLGGDDAAVGDESPFALDTSPQGPTTLEVLRQPGPPPRTSAAIAAEVRDSRVTVAASRSSERDPLPGCDPDAPVEGSNGRLADHSLCALWQEGERLRPDAAVALSALNEAFRARFGRNLCLVDSYRSLASQYSVKASRGYLAATPGRSMHGWGLAIDLCSKETGNAEVYRWLWENGPAYGWENPPWAQRGGSGKYEPWHFEYRPGVEEVSYWH
ncbi:D-alanyl-D-alanine carboxypeptidase family protein [Isoptericola variabilis]|nr:M15 family metallopeptidase [Isoptericola variabilis]